MKKSILIPLLFVTLFIGTETARAYWWLGFSGRFAKKYLTEDFWRNPPSEPQALD